MLIKNWTIVLDNKISAQCCFVNLFAYIYSLFILTCVFIAIYNTGFQHTDVFAVRSGKTTHIGVTYLKKITYYLIFIIWMKHYFWILTNNFQTLESLELPKMQQIKGFFKRTFRGKFVIQNTKNFKNKKNEGENCEVMV